MTVADECAIARPRAGEFPSNQYPPYRSTDKRAPAAVPIRIPHTASEIRGPHFGAEMRSSALADLTRPGTEASALGQRIIVYGRVTDARGRPEREALVEVWQANAAGRYRHAGDQHDAPLDPNFSGAGAAVTDADGWYRFTTIEPGAYPWPNHYNAWRPKHIHFSLFGSSWAARLVTQMYFPGDPTLAFDPIFNGIDDPAARQRVVAVFDLEESAPDFAMAYRFDVVLRGPLATPLDRQP